ncbi:hypothetical protein ACN47E_008916 [Coniothyrium glycines]
MADPSSGFAFPGLDNLHNDIYPSIDASTNSSLHQPGKAVLVTGAGRGIGRAIALQYAHADVSTLILCARTREQLDQVSSSVSQINSQCRILRYSIDVSSDAAVASLAAEITSVVGRLDVLVNNAGAAEPWVLVSDSQPRDWWRTFETNVKGPYLFLHAFLPLLVETAAARKTVVHVINMSSIGAHMVVPTASAYQTSKLALCRLTEFVDAEYAGKGVSAVAVNPGGVLTELSNGIEAIKDHLNDTAELAGGFVVWLTAGARTWLGGRYVAAPWDVDVLERMKDEIVSGDKLKAKLVT